MTLKSLSVEDYARQWAKREKEEWVKSARVRSLIQIRMG
jgi:hypothetical protein